MEKSPFEIDQEVIVKDKIGKIKYYTYLYHLDMFMYEVEFNGDIGYYYETEIKPKI